MRTIEAIDLRAVCGATNTSPACAEAIRKADHDWGETGDAGGYTTGYGALAGLVYGGIRGFKNMNGAKPTVGNVGGPIIGWTFAGAMAGRFAAPAIAKFATRHFSSACR
jgi:hypothetical protein